MAVALAKDLEYLRDFGFSDQQVEGLSRLAQKQEESLSHTTKKQVDQAEKKIVTREYLDLQADNIKKSLVIQTIGVVFSGMLLLGWYINHLDNKTRAYVSARFEGIEDRFEGMENRFKSIENRFEGMENRFKSIENRFEGMENRFDRIESDLKDIKNFMFSRSFATGKTKHTPSK